MPQRFNHASVTSASHITTYPYHNYQGNNIIDYGLKSSIIAEVGDLLIAGRRPHPRSSEKISSQAACFHPKSTDPHAISSFNKNLLSLERRIDKSQLYVKEILPQNVVLDTDGDAGDTSRD